MGEQIKSSLLLTLLLYVYSYFKFNFFGLNLPKNGFWGRNFENPDSESAPPRYHACEFSDKTDNFEFFGPNLPKNRFWAGNSESYCWNKN